MVCRLLVLYIQTLSEGSSVLRSWHMMSCMNLRQNRMSRLLASTDKKARTMLYRLVLPQCNLALPCGSYAYGMSIVCVSYACQYSF